jgi:hypothetical protein
MALCEIAVAGVFPRAPSVLRIRCIGFSSLKWILQSLFSVLKRAILGLCPLAEHGATARDNWDRRNTTKKNFTSP